MLPKTSLPFSPDFTYPSKVASASQDIPVASQGLAATCSTPTGEADPVHMPPKCANTQCDLYGKFRESDWVTCYMQLYAWR